MQQCFLVWGVNSARDEATTKYSLAGVSLLDVAPQDATPEQVASFKTEFEAWIVGNALREVMEAYALLLDEVFANCLTIQQVKCGRGIDATTRRKFLEFERQGFPNKLNNLQQAYGVGPEEPKHPLSLNRARTCLTHRRGIVSRSDANLSNRLQVSWRGMEIEVHEPDGTITPVQQLIEQQKVLKEGGHVNLRIVERSRSFECGELVRFQPQELAEILVSVHTEARQLISAMTRFAADKGVIIEEIVGDQGHP